MPVIVTTTSAEAVQPVAVVTVTLYVPVSFIVIACPVAPVFHRNSAYRGPASNTVLPQEAKSLPMFTAAPFVSTVTKVSSEAVQPLASLTVTL